MREKYNDMFCKEPTGKRVDRIDRDIVLIEDPRMDEEIYFPIKSNTAVSIIIRSGSMICNVDMVTHRINQPGMMIILPSQIIEKLSFSDGFKGYCLFLSSAFLGNMPIGNKVQILVNIKKDGFYTMDNQKLAALESYIKMVQNVLRAPNEYKREIVTHLTIAYYYGLGSYLHGSLSNKAFITRYEQISDRFLELVRDNCIIHRDMGFYANKMCLTAKHISLAVRTVTGDNAMKWIERYTILNAKSLLKTTHIPISEISDRLNFASASDFGKYFKKFTGYSPRDFRNA